MTNQCEMVNVHHPDCECATYKARQDEHCTKQSVGTYEGCRVCDECAKTMQDDGFEVVFDSKDNA